MYLVSGASGHLGQLVTQELSGKVNPKDVTLGSRHTDKLAGFAAKGFKTTRFDFDDAAGMEKALRATTRCFSFPAMARPKPAPPSSLPPLALPRPQALSASSIPASPTPPPRATLHLPNPTRKPKRR